MANYHAQSGSWFVPKAPNAQQHNFVKAKGLNEGYDVETQGKITKALRNFKPILFRDEPKQAQVKTKNNFINQILVFRYLFANLIISVQFYFFIGLSFFERPTLDHDAKAHTADFITDFMKSGRFHVDFMQILCEILKISCFTSNLSH